MWPSKTIKLSEFRQEFDRIASLKPPNNSVFLDISTFNVNGLSGLPKIGQLISENFVDLIGFQETFYDRLKVARVLKPMYDKSKQPLIVHQERNDRCESNRGGATLAICCSKGKVQGGTLSFGYASRTLKLEIIASTVWFKELKKPGLFICAYNLFDSSDFEEFKQTMRVLAGLAKHYDWYIFVAQDGNFSLKNIASHYNRVNSHSFLKMMDELGMTFLQNKAEATTTNTDYTIDHIWCNVPEEQVIGCESRILSCATTTDGHHVVWARLFLKKSSSQVVEDAAKLKFYKESVVAFKALKDALCGYGNARVMDNFKDGLEIDCAGSWFREQLHEATSAVASCSHLVDRLSFLQQQHLLRDEASTATICNQFVAISAHSKYIYENVDSVKWPLSKRPSVAEVAYVLDLMAQEPKNLWVPVKGGNNESRDTMLADLEKKLELPPGHAKITLHWSLSSFAMNARELFLPDHKMVLAQMHTVAIGQGGGDFAKISVDSFAARLKMFPCIWQYKTRAFNDDLKGSFDELAIVLGVKVTKAEELYKIAVQYSSRDLECLRFLRMDQVEKRQPQKIGVFQEFFRACHAMGLTPANGMHLNSQHMFNRIALELGKSAAGCRMLFGQVCKSQREIKTCFHLLWQLALEESNPRIALEQSFLTHIERH